jgi:hypothetical protein
VRHVTHFASVAESYLVNSEGIDRFCYGAHSDDSLADIRYDTYFCNNYKYYVFSYLQHFINDKLYFWRHNMRTDAHSNFQHL